MKEGTTTDQELDYTTERTEFTEQDHQILQSFFPVVDAIANMYGEQCEVVLHSLHDLSHSVIKIANGHITNRTLGSPVTDLAMKILKDPSIQQKEVTDCYFTKLEDGRILKSITSMIKNFKGIPIGLLCINLNLSDSMISFAKQCIPREDQNEAPEHFVSNVDDLIVAALNEAVQKISHKRKKSGTEKNKLIVSELYAKGIFDIKGAIDIVAKELGVSRYTIYNYVREAKV